MTQHWVVHCSIKDDACDLIKYAIEWRRTNQMWPIGKKNFKAKVTTLLRILKEYIEHWNLNP